MTSALRALRRRRRDSSLKIPHVALANQAPPRGPILRARAARGGLGHGSWAESKESTAPPTRERERATQTSFCVDGARRVANQPPLEGSTRGTLRSARATARAGRTSVDVIGKETYCPARRIARDDAKQKAGDGVRMSRTRGAPVESSEYKNRTSDRGGTKIQSGARVERLGDARPMQGEARSAVRSASAGWGRAQRHGKTRAKPGRRTRGHRRRHEGGRSKGREHRRCDVPEWRSSGCNRCARHFANLLY